MDSLAKSLLMKLVQKIDEEDTQKTVCQFLNNNAANEQQLTQYASIVGVPLSSEQASKIVSFATNLTSHGLKKGVSLTKRVLKLAQIGLKFVRVVAKYRHLIVYFMLLGWIKSANLRPIHVNVPVKKR